MVRRLLLGFAAVMFAFWLTGCGALGTWRCLNSAKCLIGPTLAENSACIHRPDGLSKACPALGRMHPQKEHT